MLAVRIAGVEVPHRLWTPRELSRVFAPDFIVSALSGQGIFRSVDDSGDRGMRWERAASGLPGLRSLGTFFTPGADAPWLTSFSPTRSSCATIPSRSRRCDPYAPPRHPLRRRRAAPGRL